LRSIGSAAEDLPELITATGQVNVMMSGCRQQIINSDIRLHVCGAIQACILSRSMQHHPKGTMSQQHCHLNVRPSNTTRLIHGYGNFDKLNFFACYILWIL
jgi:hypothetical protein